MNPVLLRVGAREWAISAAIVDLDGTLVDTMGDFEAALHGMLDELQLPRVDRKIIEGFVGKGSEHLIRSVLGEVTDSPAQADERYPAAWEAYQQHYARVNGKHSTLFDGAVEGLAALRAAGVPVACLTNKPTAFAKVLLADKGIDSFFACVFGGDAFERKKPDPLPLIKTCEALGVVPAKALMIGDSSNDAQAARAAGCPVALVTYGYNHGQPARSVDADAYLDSMAELSALITKRAYPAGFP